MLSLVLWCAGDGLIIPEISCDRIGGTLNSTHALTADCRMRRLINDSFLSLIGFVVLCWNCMCFLTLYFCVFLFISTFSKYLLNRNIFSLLIIVSFLTTAYCRMLSNNNMLFYGK